MIFLFERFLEVYFINVSVRSSPSLHNYSWHWDEFMGWMESLFSCYKCIDNSDLPRACVSTGFGFHSTSKSVVGSRIAQRCWTTTFHTYSISAPLWSSTLFSSCCILSQVHQVPPSFLSAQLRNFLIFLLNILKGTPASQGASKWRSWEADMSSRSRVRPVRVICEDWGLCAPPSSLHMACVADCSD